MFESGYVINERYEIKEQIGSGGGGIIYKAYDKNMQKDVAIKLIKNTSAEALENRNEIDLMKDLKSKYLPIFYDFVQNGDEVYTVMEYIDGHDIKCLVEMGKTFNEDEVVKCGIQLCEAVEELHSKRPPIIHGDIKPANVMITAIGNICLIDFNISAIMQGNKAAVKGYSKEYAAPEQTFTSKNYKQYVENPVEDDFHEETRFLLSETEKSDTYTKTLLDNRKRGTENKSAQAFIDVRTDIFGIGAVLYYMLTGHSPINGKPDFLGTEVSPKLKKIITKAMSAVPEDRYKNTEEMKADFYSNESEQTSSSVRKGRGKLIACIACVAAVIASVVIVCIERNKAADDIAVAQNETSEITSGTSVSPLAAVTSVPETTASETELSLLGDDLINPVIEYGFDESLWGELAEEIKSVVSFKSNQVKYDDSSDENELWYRYIDASDITEFDGSMFSGASISKRYCFNYTLPDYDICTDGLYSVSYYINYDSKAEWKNAVNNSLYYFTSVYGESEEIDTNNLAPNADYKHWINGFTAVCLSTGDNCDITVEFISSDAVDALFFLPIDAGESLAPLTTETNITTTIEATESSVVTTTTTVPISTTAAATTKTTSQTTETTKAESDRIAEEYSKKLNGLEVVSVDDGVVTIKFGKYNWRVLEMSEHTALIITVDCVDSMVYNTEWCSVTWETCSLRKYLNEDFYNKFNDSEKKMIKDMKVMNKDNPEYETDGGNNTVDKIFLLSLDEANKYFVSDKDRIAHYDGYVNGELWGGERYYWWLRSPGNYDICASYVYSSGYVYNSGTSVNNKRGVRPTLCLEF